jgi:uncharacterized protein YdbL (DUF1318 family)
MAAVSEEAPRSGRTPEVGEWVLLSYHLPREPSTPRISLWRQLKRLGVAQLADGLVALPADARTREQLEWVAEETVEAGGTAGVWLARPATAAQEHALAASMAAARAAEYVELAAATDAATGEAPAARGRGLQRLRRQWREITRRDFFPPPERERAAVALRVLAEVAGAGTAARQDGAGAESARSAR